MHKSLKLPKRELAELRMKSKVGITAFSVLLLKHFQSKSNEIVTFQFDVTFWEVTT